MMREADAALVRREDYAPPAYFIRTAELTFDLDAAKTIVASRLRIERNTAAAAGAPLRLHGEGLTLLRVLADGASVSFRHDDGALVIDNPPAADAFTLEIRNTCAPDRNTALTGLYTSGGGLFTQCEAEGFRRITYFVDRPDVMAVYTVTLRADRALYPVLLSNGNLVEQGELDGGRHFAKWHDPFPKPSYLFALVAARLVAREQRIRARSGREHLLQVYVRPGDLGKTEHAMRSLVAAMAWDEARFGLALDLDRYMIVAVEDYNSGAMENKGLNLFNTQYVLATAASATDADFDGIESVIAHEYFHNWTGNRVTCRDWFQLSLKEGLTVFRDQEFSSDMGSRAVERIGAVENLRRIQMPEDAGPMAHPVRPDEYQEINNFYTATVYEKGAELIRMQHALLGRERFRRGLDLYFERHDGAAVTCDDFVDAMSDASGVDLGQFRRWYSQAGTPIVRASGRYDATRRAYTLDVEQHTEPTPGQAVKEPLHIPIAVGLLGPDGGDLPFTVEGGKKEPAETVLLELRTPSRSWTFHGIDAPPVPSLARGYSAPVRVEFDYDDRALALLASHDSDPVNRWDAAQRVYTRSILALAADHRAGALGRACVDIVEAALLAPRIGETFTATVVDLAPQRGHGQTKIPCRQLRENGLWCQGPEESGGSHRYAPIPRASSSGDCRSEACKGTS